MATAQAAPIAATASVSTTPVLRLVAVGAEARIVLDALPNRPIPAKVTFVEPRSQFTPKQVETQSERDKLMFRIKVNVDPEILKRYIQQVKTGLPGMAWVRIDENRAWPDDLMVRLPQ